ncbi:hypothetical protein CV102_10215 [Natronococcus pandeyae]|uniref:Uncharacterized protein n=1 Tax=Natronococcus pandeyae TaxID=2055836 RepID=A0A8J8TQU6_9EURY|nr:hypothetical protein [Natronococcus pandeyae]TYL38873.1 hypothetical protein CV102_10215 [Natronococcus pandeyae]
MNPNALIYSGVITIAIPVSYLMLALPPSLLLVAVLGVLLIGSGLVLRVRERERGREERRRTQQNVTCEHCRSLEKRGRESCRFCGEAL